MLHVSLCCLEKRHGNTKAKDAYVLFFWCKLLAALHLSYINITLQNSLTLKHWVSEGANTITEVTQVRQILVHFQFELLLRSSPSARVFEFKLFKFTDSINGVINQVWKFKNWGFRPVIGANSSRMGVGSAGRRVRSPNCWNHACLVWLD